MRVVSQNGTIDVPYGLVALSIGFNATFTAFNVYCHSKLFDDNPCIIAAYSTEEKARASVRMAREQYQYLMEIKVTGVGATPPEFYFLFPADDEIEV